MENVYTATLLVALLAMGLGITGSLVMQIAFLRGIRLSSMQALVNFITLSGFASLVSGLVSAGVHKLHGHNIESMAPMSLFPFLAQHKIYIVILVVSGILIWSPKRLAPGGHMPKAE